MSVEKLYKKGSVNAKRIDTDKLFIDENSINEFKGIVDKTARFIEEYQLLSVEDWVRFVEQFRYITDNDDHGWRCEYWGKLMRGATFVYSYTKNEKLFAVLKNTVEDMFTVMDDAGRVSTYSVEKEFDGWDMWGRKYVLLGMQYFMEICPDERLNSRILAFMEKMADYIIDNIGEGKKDIVYSCTHWRGLPSTSILEPIVRLYDLTGEKRYIDFATYIVKRGGISLLDIFELAYNDTTDPYQYPITKAYEMISCFEGLVEYYRATGIEKHKEAVVRFARRLAKTDITIIGCAGCTHEMFDHSAARQTDPAYQGIMQETCVTVTWMKFCMQILMLTGDASFAEYFERAFYNAYLGAVNTEKVTDVTVKAKFPEAVLRDLPFDSYSSLLPNTRGRGIGGLKMMPNGQYYGCCVCIGAAGIGMVHKISTMVDKKGVTLNMYIPGRTVTVTPDDNSLELLFDTAYPSDGNVKITVNPEKTERFTVSLRIPYWSKKTLLSVNGESIATESGETDYYKEITREWSKGDVITLSLDMRARVLHPQSFGRDVLINEVQWMDRYVVPHVVEESPYAKYHIAIQRGPLVLARDARLDGTVDEAVDIKYDENGYVELTASSKANFDTLTEFSVPQANGKSFTVIDYSSAGKTWKEDSKYACWLPTKEYRR